MQRASLPSAALVPEIVTAHSDARRGRTVGARSYGHAMMTTEHVAPPSSTISTPVSQEDYWARMQELRAQLSDLQESAPAC